MALFNAEGKTSAKDFVTRLSAKGAEGEANGRELLLEANRAGTDIEGLILHKVSSDINGLTDSVSAVFAHIGMPLSSKDPRAKAMFASGSETFVTSGSLKLLIPVLMDNLVREANNRPMTEDVNNLIASDRKVGGNELITEVVYDKDTKDSYNSWRVAEGGKISVRTIKASQQAVRFYKLGAGIEFTYEAGRRIAIDRFIPFINRQKFERTQAEARYAVHTLLAGDGVHGAAPVETLVDYGATAGTKLRDNSEAFMKWLMEAAKDNRPIDTIVVNYDSLFELGFMFPVYKETSNGSPIESVGVQKIAGSTVGLNVSLTSGLSLNIKVEVSSEMPANSVLGYRKDETLERLEEIGSVIQEQESTIRTQTVLIVGTVNVGFAIAYGESRRVLSWA